MPFYVYDNWSAYDEMSDNVPLTEDLAMRQFDEVCRLRRHGVKIDAYLMDAFWYAPDGGYLTWRRDRWPNGPDRWFEACRREGILPGLWFTANTAFHFDPPAAWRDSLAGDGWGFSCTTGGFLSGFFGVLEHWYERGVRVYKFDFADFAAVAASSSNADEAQVRSENVAAYRIALKAFRARHADVVLLAYNGFEHTEYMPWTDRPVRAVMDREWLDCFDTVYCGDPRPADVPLPSFWRTLDLYADAMVHLLHRGSGLKLTEIDNCAFMIGKCGTCYKRGAAEWKTTALLSFARGGRVHVTMGNLEALTDHDARWLAQVQAYYEAAGDPAWVGGNPGQGELYAYATGNTVTAVNPSLEPRTLVVGPGFGIVYADGQIACGRDGLRLGPGSVAVVGRETAGAGDFGCMYAGGAPTHAIDVDWRQGKASVEGAVIAPRGADLHLVFQQRDGNGRAVRTSGGSPPDGQSSAEHLRITVRQGGPPIPVERPDDKIVWSGLSWAYGIVSAAELRTGEPVTVTFATDDKEVVQVLAKAYAGEKPAPASEPKCVGRPEGEIS